MKIAEIVSPEDLGYSIDAFHGTDANFDQFDPEKSLDGMHFGSTPEQANTRLTSKRDEGSNILPVKLRMKNPLRVPDLFISNQFTKKAHEWAQIPGFTMTPREKLELFNWARLADSDPYNKNNSAIWSFYRTIQKSAQRQGYDGLIYHNQYEAPGDSYVVFHPNQVRSRFAQFDPQRTDSPNLLDHQIR